jgi:hypothetical protein
MSVVPEVEPIHVPDEVRGFAEKQSLTFVLPAVLEAARRVFPGYRLTLSLDPDYILKGKYYILLTVHGVRLNDDLSRHVAEDWHYSLIDAVSPHYAAYFRLKLEHVA